MKKARKLGLQSLALVLMAFVLVAGVAFGMTFTGAWFDDNASMTATTFQFGKLDLTATNTGAVINTRTVGHALEGGKLMPGDTVTLTLAAQNAGNQSFYYMAKVVVTTSEGELASGDNISGNYTLVNDAWVAAANDNIAVAEPEASITGTLAITFDGDAYANAWQERSITINVTIYAVQAANIAVGTAYTMLTTAAA